MPQLQSVVGVLAFNPIRLSDMQHAHAQLLTCTGAVTHAVLLIWMSLNSFTRVIQSFVYTAAMFNKIRLVVKTHIHFIRDFFVWEMPTKSNVSYADMIHVIIFTLTSF